MFWRLSASTGERGKVRPVVIRSPTIGLGALLKLAQLAPTGGAAKRMIQGGGVAVNGVVERRRGRQVRPGDVVNAGGTILRVERGA
ncbi:MAG: RNA-binding S4 domain-containing protein [Armatimonadota bacterium]|nr:RNA-binding S4 domain-containing protein [Armatimonadota bacterium]MDR7451078.1 RNA-binding S4 domain-containing protein [Armatimonadota bacterium]MDR7465901.1 RNA-binding S4 domain-containing protein [Armatimonadota bacterium]MDR7493966.1 RNA-binding S4 domain-containing protein [Armatimonadota bacterium]MDR7498416.1 RNA-binding S4 domain-containing protein [Armatimonadota bacterium]